MKKFFYLLIFAFSMFCSQRAQATTYTWTGLGGLLSPGWDNFLNWSGGFLSYPGPGDDVIIQPIALGLIGGVVISYPTINAGQSFTCKSLTFTGNNLLYLSNNTTTTLTINGSLTVTGAITQNFKTVNGSTDVLVSGTGSLSGASFTLGDGSTVPASAGTNVSTFRSDIAQLSISGAVTVNSFASGSAINNGSFSVINETNVNTNLTAGSLALVTPSSAALSNISLTNSTANATAHNINLLLTGAVPIVIPATPRGSIDLYNVTGTNTGRIKTEYGGSSSTTPPVTLQTVATNPTGLDANPAIYQDIAFSGNAEKRFTSGTPTINGNWTSAGGKINATTNNPTISFIGASAQTLTDGGSTGTYGVLFKNVSFSGAGLKTISSGKFAVSGVGVLTMVTTAKLAVGASGTLTLISDATGDATVPSLAGGGSITGNVNVQRYFKNGLQATTRNYRLLSSAVNNGSGLTSLTYLSSGTGVYTGGPGGSANGFTVDNATPTIYLYRENISVSNATFNSGNFKGLTNIATANMRVYNYKGTTDTAAVLYPGNGIMLYYVGNNVANLTQKKTGIDPDSSTTTAVGGLNQGNVAVKLWWSNSTALSGVKTMFQLVGNPYPSAIDWNTFGTGITTTSVSSTIYMFNYTSKNYGTYQANIGVDRGTNNASRYIASGQGFFIKMLANGGNITFTEAAKTNTQPGSLGSSYLLMGTPVAEAKPQMLRIRLAKDNANYDESIVLFEDQASDDYEEGIDAIRLNGMGNVASLGTYTAQNAQTLAINHMHSISASTRVKLLVNMTGAASLDTLTMTGFDSLDQRYDAFLIDHYKNDSLQISIYGKYMFNVLPTDAASFGTNRFELVFHPKGSYNYRLLSFTGKSTTNAVQLEWKTENEQNLTGFTLQKADGSSNYLPIYNLKSNGDGKYVYTDKTPVTGANNYRLLQNDPFSKISSTDLTVNFTPSTTDQQALMIYPNPVATQMSVKINSSDVPAYVSLKVMSLNGQTLIKSVQNSGNIQQNTSNLMPGVYVVEVADNQTQKLIGRTKITKP